MYKQIKRGPSENSLVNLIDNITARYEGDDRKSNFLNQTDFRKIQLDQYKTIWIDILIFMIYFFCDP